MEDNKQFTTQEVCERLGLGNSVVMRRAKAIGIKLEMGKFTYYSEQDIENIDNYKNYIDKSIRVTDSKWTNGERRVYISAYNEKLHMRVRIVRAHYNYLNSTGEWDLGVTRIPKGNVIHHIDGNFLNDDASNLQMMTISEHRKYHDSISNSRVINSIIAMKANKERRAI